MTISRAVEVESRTASETERLGRRLGKLLAAGDVVALSGPLGAGKTAFVKGVASGAGADGSAVSSPTFALLHEYSAKKIRIYHMDWYRLPDLGARDRAWISECLDADGVCLIEWPERGEDLLDPDRVSVRLDHAGGDRRRLTLSAGGERSRRIVGLWRASS
jgi:tRNA threonylcarbamoyladenosine biosynthesis protein TsaE